MKQTINGACPACKSTDLILAVDKTDYSRCTYKDNRFTTEYICTELSDCPNNGLLEDASVRLFCANCGEYLQVPKKLTGNIDRLMAQKRT